MDEVWLVSLCFTFLAFVVVLLSLKKADDEGESAAKAQERSAAPVFASAQPAARFMEMTLEDIEKSLQRLGAVLGTEPEKQQQHPAQHEERKEQSGGEVRSAPVSQVKIRPSEQPDPWRHGGGEGIETLEHPPVTSSTRTIMEQIEQAVQETPDHNKERSEYVRVRRAPPAPRFETPPRDDVPESRSMHSSD